MNAPMNLIAPKFYDYRFGPEPVALMGRMRAFGTRILCRAILKNDHYTGTLTLVEYSAAEAVAFEVLSVGAGVAAKCAEMGEQVPTAGQHCDVRSVAADRVNPADPLGRYWLVDVADVAAVWDPVEGDAEGLIEACIAVAERSKQMAVAAKPTGEVELVEG